MEVESTNANPVGVKLSFGPEMRRFQFPGGSFNAFKAQVISILGLEPTTDVSLKYTDEENDLITLSSDLELRSAIVLNQLLRVTVSLRNFPSAPLPSVASNINNNDTMSCDEPIQFYPGYPQIAQGGIALPPSAQFYQPYHQGEKWNRRSDGDKHDKLAKKERKEEEKREKKERKEEEKREKKMFKKMGGRRPHSPPHHHPYMHPHAHHGNHPHPPHAHHHHGPHDRHHGPHDHHHHERKHEDKHGMFVARFVADVTTQDGTVLAPNTPFVKTWRLRNEGAAWPVDCGLFYIGRLSDQLSAPSFLPLGEIVAPHQEVNVSVPLVAPDKPGRYTAYFRMCTASGVKFGQRVWVSIVVPASDSSSEGEKEADKYEGLVDVVMRNEMFRSVGLKRHWVFRQLQKHDGDVDKVTEIMTKKVEKKMKKLQK